MRFINLFALPSVAACVVFGGLRSLVPFNQALNVDMLTDALQYNIVFAVLGFLFGFLPCLIYGLAVRALSPISGPVAVVVAPAVVFSSPVADSVRLSVGMLIAAPAANCVCRVKSLNVRALLEFNNPDFEDYL